MWLCVAIKLQNNTLAAQLTLRLAFSPDWNPVTKKIRLNIREDIQTTPIVVTTSSSDVADEEQFFFTFAHNKEGS